jgi:hypothetical protein
MASIYLPNVLTRIIKNVLFINDSYFSQRQIYLQTSEDQSKQSKRGSSCIEFAEVTGRCIARGSSLGKCPVERILSHSPKPDYVMIYIDCFFFHWLVFFLRNIFSSLAHLQAALSKVVRVFFFCVCVREDGHWSDLQVVTNVSNRS